MISFIEFLETSFYMLTLNLNVRVLAMSPVYESNLVNFFFTLKLDIFKIGFKVNTK